MAAIDSLIKLMDAQGADGLVIVPDGVPTLDRAGRSIRLSMPEIPSQMVMSFARDVVGPEGSAALEARERLEGTYLTDDGSSFSYEVRPEPRGCRLSLKPLGPRTPPPDDLVPDPGKRDGPVVQDAHGPDLVQVVELALERGASDLFLSAGEQPRIRVDGVVEAVDGPVVDGPQVLALVGAALTDARRTELEETGSADLALELDVAGARRRLRASLFEHHHGLAVALRPIRERAPGLEELNLPDDLLTLCSLRHGLILVTGAAGSGKSTTLASLVEHINRTRACHIVTLEDPIEFEHANRRAIVHQREVGRHVASFSAGLRAALRESPDVILVGEMRDRATIAAALTAAETGHLVLSTLHTGDAASAIDRIIDAFPGHQQPQARLQLASCLRAVVTQILVPSTRRPGRVPAIEKLVITDGVACQIRDGRNHQVSSLIQAGGGEGMITLERSLASLVRSGKITEQTALAHARDERGLRNLIRGGGAALR